MQERTKFHVGLDVHKDSISVAAAEVGRMPARLIGKVAHDLNKLLKVLARIGGAEQLHLVYEAGPTGFGMQRALAAKGYVCEIIAPSQVPKRPGDRVKTDGRDCLQLAECSRAGQLSAVWIPDPCDEAIRDLSRAREDAVNSRVQARHQLKGFLLRHDNPLLRQEFVELGLLPLAIDVELRGRRQPDGVYRVLARGRVRRCARGATDEGIGRLYRGMALRAGGQGAAGASWRGRHHGHRPGSRDRGPHTLLSPSQTHGLPRSGSFGALERRAYPPRQHHEDRQRARTASADRSGLELSLQGPDWPGSAGTPGSVVRAATI